MLRIKGIYDGQKVVLTEPVTLPSNTAVEVIITDPENSANNSTISGCSNSA